MQRLTLSQGDFTTVAISEVDNSVVSFPVDNDNLERFLTRWECIAGPVHENGRTKSVWVRRESNER